MGVTAPGNQESAAGFRPTCFIDWIPQHDHLIEGHAIYQSLVGISAIKLLCWVPNKMSAKKSHTTGAVSGHVVLPIVHKNHTYAEDSLLLRDFVDGYEVHQEQEVMVTVRIKGGLESPPYKFLLGDWLVLDEELKCLTSFDARTQ